MAFLLHQMHVAFIIFWHFNRQLNIERLVNLLYRNYNISVVCLDKPQNQLKVKLQVVLYSVIISMVIRLHLN